MYKVPEYLPCAVEYNANQNAKVLAGILGLAALLLSFGFLLTNSGSQDYKFLTDLFNASQWFLILCTYGIVKIYQSIRGVGYILDLVTSISGVWIWNYIFMSFVIFDSRPITPIEILLLLPLIIEAWELALDIFSFKARRKQIKESI